MRDLFFLITCEHGGNRIPGKYSSLFAARRSLLEGHRGHDPGSLEMARALAEKLGAPLIHSTVSRLLVELNRSPHHRGIFSEITSPLPPDEKNRILEKWYFPYRNRVKETVSTAMGRGMRVIHISSHSFVPVLNGERRTADIGLLYDPRRAEEKNLCLRWEKELSKAAPDLRVRRNYPYRGREDGLTTSMRKLFPGNYLGIELEINQKFFLKDPARWKKVKKALLESLPPACQAGW